MRFTAPILSLLPCLMLLAACGAGSDENFVNVAFIGEASAAEESGLRLSPVGQHLRAATAPGLVTLDADGAVVTGIAESWIVTDDGRSYIFRLRDTQWPDGGDVTSESVRTRMQATIDRLDGTSLGRDLAIVEDVIARAGRVVEFELSSPMPDFLQLLAQPELGLRDGRGGIGPMQVEQDGDRLILEPRLPGDILPEEAEEWREGVIPVALDIVDAPAAIDMFETGRVDLVLNGHIAHLPMTDMGPLSRGTVRLDGAIGLFGFRIREADGFLATPENREALALAIDRSEVMQPFNIGGWQPTTRIVPASLALEPGEIAERWAGLDMTQRLSRARARAAQWQAASGQPVTIRVLMPAGPGSDILFDRLASDWGAAGIRAVRVEERARADLILVDRVARFGTSRWFLNQFACPLGGGLCSEDADALVEQALVSVDEPTREQLLADAEEALLAENVFIPLGAPIRWSLVRGNITGFAENPWAIHPLFPLSQRPI